MTNPPVIPQLDRPGIVLFDMDNTMMDMSNPFITEACGLAGIDPLPAERHISFYQEQVYPPEHQPMFRTVIDRPGFFLDLEPYPGAVEAYHRASERWLVMFATAQLNSNPTCASDKVASLTRHFGAEAATRIAMTMDKGLLMGDVLVDDKDRIVTRFTPTWTQVVFDQPYNQATPGLRITNWEDGTWEDAIEEAFDAMLSEGRFGPDGWRADGYSQPGRIAS